MRRILELQARNDMSPSHHASFHLGDEHLAHALRVHAREAPPDLVRTDRVAELCGQLGQRSRIACERGTDLRLVRYGHCGTSTHLRAGG